VKLLVQPRDGVAPIVSAIKGAKKSIDMVIFRFDRAEIEKALHAAILRGVNVRTLIANTNRGGEKSLRKLEERLLEAGARVARTADDLVRYHGKFMVIDKTTLWLFGFNFTALDIEKSRSFGIVTKKKKTVREALNLFEADSGRQAFESGSNVLVVSPENAREQLAAFISGAKKQLLIYDPKVSDAAMLKLLNERAKAGVEVRIIGKVGKRAVGLEHEKYPGKRLHIRAILRDGTHAFMGSQSLRKLELDERREVGLIVRNEHIVKQMIATFEEDWALTDEGKQQKEEQKEAKEEKDEKEKKVERREGLGAGH
jgi:phosphatidylserine/phosphatidylglycerophosphate/cardiolipin synthase-like enzyme